MMRILKKIKEKIPGRVRNHETKRGKNKTRTEVYKKEQIRDSKNQNILNDEIFENVTDDKSLDTKAGHKDRVQQIKIWDCMSLPECNPER